MRKKIKRYITIILALVLCISFTACSGSSGSTSTTMDSWEEELEAAESISVEKCCDEDLYGDDSIYIGMQNYIDNLNVEAPDNEFTKAITEEYNAIDLKDTTDLEKDLFNTIITLATWLKDSDSQIELGKGWVLGYENQNAINSYRLIILEMIEVSEDGSKSEIQYAGCQTEEYNGEIRYWSLWSVDPESLKDMTSIDVAENKGTCTFFEEEGFVSNYFSINSEDINKVYEKESRLMSILIPYYLDVYCEPVIPSYNSDNEDTTTNLWTEPEYESKWDKMTEKEQKQWIKDNYGDGKYEDIRNAIDNY